VTIWQWQKAARSNYHTMITLIMTTRSNYITGDGVRWWYLQWLARQNVFVIGGCSSVLVRRRGDLQSGVRYRELCSMNRLGCKPHGEGRGAAIVFPTRDSFSGVTVVLSALEIKPQVGEATATPLRKIYSSANRGCISSS